MNSVSDVLLTELLSSFMDNNFIIIKTSNIKILQYIEDILIIMVDSYKAHIPSNKMLVALIYIGKFWGSFITFPFMLFKL